MAAAHISDTGAALQFVDRTVERRQPAVDQIIVIAWPEKSSDATEKTARLVAPRHPNPTASARRIHAAWFRPCSLSPSKLRVCRVDPRDLQHNVPATPRDSGAETVGPVYESTKPVTRACGSGRSSALLLVSRPA